MWFLTGLCHIVVAFLYGDTPDPLVLPFETST